MTPLVALDGVTVRLGRATALAPIDVEVRAGEVLVVHGRSGVGKSTLLGVLAGWHLPTGGAIRWSGALGAERWRWAHTAFVPQSLALLEELSILDNVALGPRLAGTPWTESRRAAGARLDALGIGDLGRRFPVEVSLGQQQRAAVARAVVLGSALVLADEPTAHLDAASTARVLAELRRAAAAGSAVVVASHDPAVLAAADRGVAL